jgi:formylglycine-generating enzyme required for sulfatase activity
MKNRNSTKNFKALISTERESLHPMNEKRSQQWVRIITFFSFLFLCGNSILANNLVIGGTTVVGDDLQFTIQWDNSWNSVTGPTNYDAVWVFVKRQVCGNTPTWDHALLNTSSASHSVTGGVLQVDAVSDGVGVFIRRSAPGNGNIASSTVTLDLQTAANSIDNFQVFGIEMVFIPTGNFQIGDFTSTYGFNGVTITAATQASGFANANAYLSNGSWGSFGALPPSYPQGYNAFYCMRYEISQEQYVKFLNSLTFTQQTGRINISPASAIGSWPMQSASPNNARNGIRIMTPGVFPTIPAIFGCDLNVNGTFNEAADGQNIACNWLSWPDLMTYLDWSGLRPMTEMEFEKVCRGPAPIIPGEFAWGSTTALQAISTSLTNSGQGSEVSTASGNGLCAYNASNQSTFGPLRCGFAAGAATNRFQSGASYYGVMEMSGNVAEQCVGGYNFSYGSFNGLNGNGAITAAGSANTANWPTAGGGQNGGVARGGYFGPMSSGIVEMRVSDRNWMTSNWNQSKNSAGGGRGVRNP